MNDYQPGSIVSLRDRDWIVQPSASPDVIELRPLIGGEQEKLKVYRRLALEMPEPATFPLPDSHYPGDFSSARLLMDAVRLSLRSGAGPFRSLGQISVRPRPYQFVPLMMALRHEPAVRILIADDVGIGKTIEAGLIARELYDRGEIQRLAVLCPPYLCEQWQQELQEKFHLPAVIVRSGTISRLERELPRQDMSIFQYFTCMVISIDYAKAERRRDSFLLHAPELIIVDEAHSVARPAGRSISQQQRHELVHELAKKAERHLILLTATPHSGIEGSFKSLLGLLKPYFEEWDTANLTEQQQIELARHLVQRRRADVKSWLGEDTPFPERNSREVAYALHTEYRALAEDVYRFASEIVRTGESLSGFSRRVRYWTALALMRCVMSSPAAAEAALEGRARRLDDQEGGEPDDTFFSPYIYDAPDAEFAVIDVSPSYVLDQGELSLRSSEQRRLREFADRVRKLRGDKDTKVESLAALVAEQLQKGNDVIVYCRYVATAEYVAAELNQRLERHAPKARIIAVTGTLSEDERRARILELAESEQRVLVATDCLSEGINLQDWFNAVIHYDLPWNPNRLEQREGRVDRFGQANPRVDTILLYGKDNPIDGKVLDVLIRKAIEIRDRLGVTVPVPVESESVVEAVARSLFFQDHRNPEQLELPGMEATPFERIEEVHRRWYASAERERENRTRFAQRGIKPEMVAAEIEAVDHVLGDPQAVQRFVLTACQRLGIHLIESRAGWKLSPEAIPQGILGEQLGLASPITMAFTSPAPQGAEYVGRHHRITVALAEHILSTALTGSDGAVPVAARCGVHRSNMVARQTTVLLLRLRYLMHEARAPRDIMAEECIVAGYRKDDNRVEWLQSAEAKALVEATIPQGQLSSLDIHRRLESELAFIQQAMSQEIAQIAERRARDLLDAHRRVRQTVQLGSISVKPVLPVDVIGVYILVPMPTLGNS